MVVQNNISAMNAHRVLGNNNSALSGNLEKLSSGYQINKAADDAAGLAISEKMRAQLKGLEAADKNANDGISLVQTAEGALTEVHSMLNRMAYLSTQAANGTYADDERAKLQAEVSALNEEIDRISESTQFNGIDLLQNGQTLNIPDVVVDPIPDAATTAGVQNLSGVIGGGASGTALISISSSIGKGNLELVYNQGSDAVSATVDSAGNVTILVGASCADVSASSIQSAVKSAAAASNLSSMYADYTVTLTDDEGEDMSGTDLVGILASNTDSSGTINSTKITGIHSGTPTASGSMSMNVALGLASGTSLVTAPRIQVSGGVEGASITFEVKDSLVIGTNTAATGVKVSVADNGDITVSFAGVGTSGITQADMDSAIKVALAGAANDAQRNALTGLEIDILTGDGKGTISKDYFDELDTLSGGTTTDGTIYTDNIYFQEPLSGASTVKVTGIDNAVDDFTLNVSGGVIGTNISVEYKDLAADGITANAAVSVDSFGNVNVALANNGGASGAIVQSDIDKAIQTEINRLMNEDDGVNKYANEIKALQGMEIGIQGGVIPFDAPATESKAEVKDGKLQEINNLSTGSKPGDVVLQVGETRDDFQQVAVPIYNMDAASLKTDSIDISYLQGAQAAIESIENAIDAVSQVRSNFGAIQNRLDHTINNLGVASENLQAAESRIRDTDMAKEMMYYTKNNILVQSAQAMLSQANQVPQGVLSLLQ